MGRKFLFCGLALAALCLGCTTIAEGVRNMIIEPAEFCKGLDDCIDRKRNRALAWQAWVEFVQECPERATYSEAFGQGFRDGFADYLFAGGAGSPPPVPPRYYWRPEFQNPEGQVIMRDWFAGFRLGAAVAMRSGLRRLVTVPASVALPLRTMPATLYPPVRPGGPGPEKLETLPVPKILPPGADKKDDAGRKQAPPAQGVSHERLVPVPAEFTPTAEPPLPNKKAQTRPGQTPANRKPAPSPVGSEPGEGEIIAWLGFSAPVDDDALPPPDEEAAAIGRRLLALCGSRPAGTAEAGVARGNTPEADKTGERPAVSPRSGFGLVAWWVARP